MRRALVAVAVWAGVSLSACRSGPTARINVPQDLQVHAVAVYPFGFRWEEPAYRSFELSGRLIDVVLEKAQDRALVFGPAEFRVYRPEDDNIFAATTLGQLLPPLQLRPASLLVIRPWAEKRVHTSSKTLMNQSGKAVGAERHEETTYVGHVEVVHAATREVLVELRAERVSDPFAEREDDGADPAPELTELMQELVAEATRAVAERLALQPAAVDAGGYALAVPPQPAFSYSESGRPSYEGQVARMDVLDRELFLLSRARFANPALRETQVRQLLSLPGGVYVRGAPEGSPIRPGDTIMQVNGQPAFKHSFVRARLLPGPDTVRVRRASGDYEDVVVR